MSIQYRPLSGGLPYSPSRDIVFCYPAVFRTMVRQLAAHSSKAGQLCMDLLGVKDEELAKASYVLAKTLSECREGEALEAALRRRGWYNLSEAAQFVLMGYLGQVMTATLYVHLQDAGDAPEASAGVKRMITAAAIARRVFSMSPARRFFYFLFRPLRMTLRRFWTRVQNLLG